MGRGQCLCVPFVMQPRQPFLDLAASCSGGMQAQDAFRDEKGKVLSLVHEVPELIGRKDVKRILEIYDTRNPLFRTFEDDSEYLEKVDGEAFRRFVGGLAKLESSSIQRKDVRVDLLARNVALATGIDDWTSKKDNKTTRGRSRFTIVFRKNGTWKVIHEHFTRIR